MDNFQKIYESILEETWIGDIKIKKGKMKKVLGIPDDKKVSDVYTSGEKLAKDLTDKVGLKEAQGMLAFAANANKEEDIFDKALKNLPKK